jgi:glycosyltransferase involved in cell wall biosynthesis
MDSSMPGVLQPIRTPAPEERIAVIITTFNDTEFLSDALSSVFAQTHAADQIIVVDDGSDQSPANLLEGFPNVILIRKQNGGLASARNTGLRRSTSGLVCFLDADDRLKPGALAAGLACFRSCPQAALVYGGHHRIGPDGSQRGPENYKPPGNDPYATLLTGNVIGMHAAVLYRRDVLLAAGGYDEQLRRGEDYDLYLRIAQRYPIASHPQIVAEYRWHGNNVSRNTAEMLETILSIHDKHRPTGGYRLDFWLQGRRAWHDWYTTGQRKAWPLGPTNDPNPAPVDSSPKLLLKRLIRAVVPKKSHWPPLLGKIDFGSLASTLPVSMDFGWDRGTPVDRYYIESFLKDRSADIQERVLEIGDDSYSRRFGSGITHQDVLHINSENPKVTITGDITTPGVLPEGVFDCIICTQTLQLIYEIDKAVERLHAALKPGGVLLLTVPGISQIDRHEWGTNWCWSFSVNSVHRLFERVFGRGDLQLSTHGNVFAAICFLTGAVLEELDTKKLDVHDPAYPVIITLRAQRV